MVIDNSKKKLKIIIITEDAADDSFVTLKNIINSILKNNFSNFQTHIIDYEFPEKHKDIMKANLWTDKKPGNKITSFKRKLNSYINDTNTYVFWHFDGDKKWKDSKLGKSTKILDQFQKFVEPIKSRNKDLIDKIFLLVPFYSIESWLYQNDNALKKLDKKAVSEILEMDDSNLDEIFKIKENFKLGSEANFELSKNFPYQKAYDVKKSFHHSVENIFSNSNFVDRVELTQSEYVKCTK